MRAIAEPPSDPFQVAEEKSSSEIELVLHEGKKVMSRRRKALKLLLLGQSESGKSSMLKNFHITFAPKFFESERLLWRVIVQLNIIGSIRTILDALKEEYEPSSGTTTTSPPNSPIDSPLRSLRRIQLGFSPLFFVESSLLKVLAPGCPDSRDLTMRAGNGWKSLVRSGNGPELGIRVENDPTPVLVAQRDDIIGLWEDPNTRAVLDRHRPGFQDSPGFFLNDIARIALLDYVPTDLDIIRARVRTTGVEEHTFIVEKGCGANTECFIADVGGARHQRASWAPFFDDVHAIFFLAPLAFNQFLAEDPKVNRLEDSLHLWRGVCANKLLFNANIILFFNKRDVLAATLASGVKVNAFVPAYGDLPNDVPTVTKYFKEKFHISHKKNADKRPFICHETSALDIKSMASLLVIIHESIVRQSLRNSNVL